MSLFRKVAAQKGAVLLSLVLFGVLLSGAGLSLVLLHSQLQVSYVDVVANAIANRTNLIYAEQRRLGRMPTVSELIAAQQSSNIIWAFEITEYSNERLVYRLPLSLPRWQQRLIERVQGTVNSGHWYGELQLPVVTPD